ncbi:hypothetical protein SADUNF_Sadunf06G0211700 [Salix dunnii]|uniref:Uncharacterized protein n=1 Tax=Salix dunnii TaxID=1413687 RepID=A0A835K8G5_9ROSI|nr:hypothetical protein SADUNF_Sadunf06G0211700 [Salix dunnii]
MKRTHISYSLDRTCLILFITLALLSLILLLIVGQNKSFPSTDTSPNQQKFSILDQNLNDPSQLPRLPRFAYFISGTKGDVSSVKRLLQAVYHPRNYYLLHLDFEASDGERLELAKYVKVESGVIREFGNVLVLGKGDLVTYKGPTMIASILHGVAILLKQFEDWDWFVNLSAEDYPLMPQDDSVVYSFGSVNVVHKDNVEGCIKWIWKLAMLGCVKFLLPEIMVYSDLYILHIFSYLPRDLNFLEHTSGIGWKEYQRAKPIIIDPGLYHTKKSGVFWAKEKRSLPAAFKLFMGSELVVLTRSFLEFCVWGWDNLPRTVLMYYTNFLSSSEGYFHTVICNQKDYQNTTVNHDLHYLKWDNPPKQYPLNLTLEHFEEMVASGAPFARKFAKDDPVLNKIEKELLGIPDGQLARGRWCAGKSLSDKDVCVVYGSPYAVKPSTVNSKRLEKLMVKLLDSENFRSKQWNQNGSSQLLPKSSTTKKTSSFLKQPILNTREIHSGKMQNSRAMIEEKQLGFFDLLKESLKIAIRNPSFIIPAFFSSLPLFSFLIMYETVFQQTMIKILKYILQERTSPLDVIVYYYETLEASERFVEEISSKFLLCFIYLGILHLLDLFNMITVVDIGSMIYKGDQKSMNLKNMLSRCIKETRHKGPLITSIYALLLDSLVSAGLVSLVMYMCLGSISSFFSMVFSLVFLGLLSKYIEWSAVWNMGILISILEEKQGDVALIISSYLTRGSRHHGFLLMLVFFAWRLALRTAFIYVGWDNGGRGVAVTIVHTSLVCSAKMWLWLVFIVYFYECKKKSLSGKNDEEGGQVET